MVGSLTPVLAGMSPILAGCPALIAEPEPRTWKPNAGLASAWQMIRSMDAAGYLGVVMPRFLLRLPYGKDAAQTDAFAFEEMLTPEHEHYLWGSGAVLCALLLAESFVASGWDLQFDEGREIHDSHRDIYQ